MARTLNYEEGVPVFVMMPLDSADIVKTQSGQWLLSQALSKLKNAGVKGVMMDVWWGLVEKNAPGSYDWSAYDTLVKIIAENELKLQAVMSFHQCGGNVGDAVYIPLPGWVLEESHSNPDIFYTDQSGWRNPEYITLGCDTLPVIAGRTPIQCYSDYMTSFRENFKSVLGDVIIEIQVGMGPAGELRYPAYPQAENQWNFPGIGELQCYDKYLVGSLKTKAASIGKPQYGKIPTDAGTYNQFPQETGFWKDNGTWKTPYGQFFLQWYSDQIVAHGDRVLTVANRVFKDQGLIISAKISGIHWQYKTLSHASECAVGYYNADKRDGYLPLARLFARQNTVFNFTCLEMRDSEQTDPNCNSSPEALIKQVAAACRKTGVRMSGENALNRYDEYAYQQITDTASLQFGQNLGGDTLLSFTYLRLSDELFKGENFELFEEFVHNMSKVTVGSRYETETTSALETSEIQNDLSMRPCSAETGTLETSVNPTLCPGATLTLENTLSAIVHRPPATTVEA
ncbi:hypothetical protein R1flu_026380 [Riccia fluitans]|uniref:Beta-amylase n=1 Tax=Riccia fluitans TaxID=41844 RepID=A0ABD1XFT4_9MARC